MVTRSDLEEVCGIHHYVLTFIQGWREQLIQCCNFYWRLLLVDATNAFNSMNRVPAVWNARVLWPCCSRFLLNTYCGYASLLLQDDSKGLFSRKGAI